MTPISAGAARILAMRSGPAGSGRTPEEPAITHIPAPVLAVRVGSPASSNDLSVPLAPALRPAAPDPPVSLGGLAPLAVPYQIAQRLRRAARTGCRLDRRPQRRSAGSRPVCPQRTAPMTTQTSAHRGPARCSLAGPAAVGSARRHRCSFRSALLLAVLVAAALGSWAGDAAAAPAGIGSLQSFASRLTHDVTALAASVAVLFLALSGVRWTMSSGNPVRQAEARSGLIAAATGLAIALSANVIVDLLLAALR